MKRVHFSRDGARPVCAAPGRNPGSSYTVTDDKTKVTCRRRECQQEADAPQTFSHWHDEYQKGHGIGTGGT